MSGIVKKILNQKKMFAALSLFVVLVTGFVIFKLYILTATLIIVAIVNELTFRKINKQKAPFGTMSRIRNVECLVIGDVSLKTAKYLAGNNSTVCIQSPDCTLVGVYEVLRHTFSILTEDGGKAILVVKKKNIEKVRYSIFEVVFFHVVTIHRNGLKNKRRMSRFPIIFSPVKSLIFLSEAFPTRKRKEHFDMNIQNFCLERRIEVNILEI